MNISIDTTGDLRAVAGNTQPVAPPNIREASFEDHDQIGALQLRYGLDTSSRETWMALWRGNPVYERQEGQWPIGWVLESESGEIVGWIGNIPLAYQFQGRELRAATARAWVVDMRYRAYSMLTLKRFIHQKDVDLFVFNTVSSSAEPVYRLFRMSKVPVGTWHKSAFWITNYRGFSKSALSRKSVPSAAIVSYPVSAALFCLDRFKDDGLRVRGSTSEIELCSEFDSRFDDFWEELKRQKDNVLLAVRTRETLVWHFRDALMRQKVWILASSKGSRLAAYAIFDRQDNTALGLKRVRLVDFQALSGSEGALRSALRWMLHKCRQEGIHVLEITGCWLDRPELPRIMAPHHRTLPSWTYYYKSNDKDLGETLEDPKVWAPSSFDGDASL